MIDALLLFSDAQAVTATAVSTNTVDLKATGYDLGLGVDLYVNFSVPTAAAAAGAATVTFQVITSDAVDLSSPAVLVQTDAIGKAELTAGRPIISLEVPPAVLISSAAKRYIGARYLVGTGPLTAGAFTASLSNRAPDDWRKGLQPSGFRVF